MLASTTINGPIGEITPATLTASLTGTSSKVYDSTTASTLGNANYILSGILGNDQVMLNNPASGLYDSANAGTGKMVTVGGLSLLNNGLGNYVLASTTINGPIGEIKSAPVTVSLVGSTTKVYNTTTTASVTSANFSSLGGVFPGDVVVLNPGVANYETASVGSSKTVTVSVALNNPNYQVVDNMGNAITGISGMIGQITPAPVTVNLEGSTGKVYDTTTAASVTSGNFSGLGGIFPGDVVVLNPGVANYDTPSVGSSKAVTVSVGLNNANYQIVDAGGNVITSISGTIGTITPATVTSKLVGFAIKVYDGTTVASVAPDNFSSLGGVFPGDVVTVNPGVANYDNAFVGSSKSVSVRVSLNNANYQIVDAGGNVITSITGPIGVITPAPVTVSLGGSGGGSGNITPVTVSLIGSTTKVYDGTTVAIVGPDNFSNLGGVIPGDVVALNPVLLGTYSDPNVGINKLVTVNVSLDNANYQIVDGSGNMITSISGTIGNITPAPVTVSLVGSTTKVYDKTMTAGVSSGNFSSLAGVLPGEAVALNPVVSGLFSDPNAGIHKMVTVNVGLNNANYQLVDGNGNAITSITGSIGQITPATLTASLTGQTTKVYDTTTASTLTGANYVLSGILGNDQVVLNNPVSGIFDTPNVGRAKVVSVDGLLLSGGSASNYKLQSTSINGAIGKITPATLTASLTGQTTKVYDGTTSALLSDANFILNGILGNDMIALNNPSLGSYDSPNPGSVNVTVGGLLLLNNKFKNYKLVSTTVSGSIGSITTPPANPDVAALVQNHVTPSSVGSSIGASGESESGAKDSSTPSDSDSSSSTPGASDKKASSDKTASSGKLGKSASSYSVAGGRMVHGSGGGHSGLQRVISGFQLNNHVAARAGADEFQKLNPFAESSGGGNAVESAGSASAFGGSGSVGGSKSASSPLNSSGMAAMAPLNDLSAIMLVF